MYPGVPPTVFPITVAVTVGATQSAAAANVSLEFDEVALNFAQVVPVPPPSSRPITNAMVMPAIASRLRVMRHLGPDGAPDPRQEMGAQHDRRDHQQGQVPSGGMSPADPVADPGDPKDDPADGRPRGDRPVLP